jgi:VIT1/CCC1 family predicted Fe2+/Mn2+ transporter
MFLVFPYVIKHHGFWMAIIISIVVTILSFVVFANITKKFGIRLL